MCKCTAVATAMPHPECVTLKEYIGVIWIGDTPGRRLKILAHSGEDAVQQLNAAYGDGHTFTLYNEEDADRPR